MYIVVKNCAFPIDRKAWVSPLTSVQGCPPTLPDKVVVGMSKLLPPPLLPQPPTVNATATSNARASFMPSWYTRGTPAPTSSPDDEHGEAGQEQGGDRGSIQAHGAPAAPRATHPVEVRRRGVRADAGEPVGAGVHRRGTGRRAGVERQRDAAVARHSPGIGAQERGERVDQAGVVIDRALVGQPVAVVIRPI